MLNCEKENEKKEKIVARQIRAEARKLLAAASTSSYFNRIQDETIPAAYDLLINENDWKAIYVSVQGVIDGLNCKVQIDDYTISCCTGASDRLDTLITVQNALKKLNRVDFEGVPSKENTDNSADYWKAKYEEEHAKFEEFRSLLKVIFDSFMG